MLDGSRVMVHDPLLTGASGPCSQFLVFVVEYMAKEGMVPAETEIPCARAVLPVFRATMTTLPDTGSRYAERTTLRCGVVVQAI